MENLPDFRYCGIPIPSFTLPRDQAMTHPHTGRPTGRPPKPIGQKRRTVVFRLPPDMIAAIDDLRRRGGYASRTAFVEQAVDRAVSVERRRLLGRH